MDSKWTVASFGNDCLGNITGYVVERRGWVPSLSSTRSDGLIYVRQVARTFCGNIYVQGSFEKAYESAQTLCKQLNELPCSAL